MSRPPKARQCRCLDTLHSCAISPHVKIFGIENFFAYNNLSARIDRKNFLYRANSCPKSKKSAYNKLARILNALLTQSIERSQNLYIPNNNTLPLSGLCIDNTCLGQDMVVTGVRPYYTYENGVRTDKLEGFRYSVILLEKGYYALNVKIPGEQKIELVPGQSIPVKFTGLKLKLYYDRAKRVQIAASAEDISPLE